MVSYWFGAGVRIAASDSLSMSRHENAEKSVEAAAAALCPVGSISADRA